MVLKMSPYIHQYKMSQRPHVTGQRHQDKGTSQGVVHPLILAIVRKMRQAGIAERPAGATQQVPAETVW